MVKRQQSGQARSRRRWVSLLVSGSLGLAITLATGCSSTPIASTPAPDPLTGPIVPPGLPQPAAVSKADSARVTPVPQASKTGGVPALPTSFSSSNPATLAATSGQSPLGRPLALDDNYGGPPFLPTSANRAVQPSTALGVNPNPKVERVPDIAAPATQPNPPATAGQAIPPAVQPVSGSQPTGDDALRKQLEDHGVINQKLTPIAGGVRLTCYVSRGPGLGLHSVEVTAVDFAAAAQAVLQQLATQP